MEQGCEHAEGSPIGKCAICERTVCTECYNDVFGTMICDLHAGLEDDSAWELVGLLSDRALVVQRRYVLEESGLTSLVVDSDEDAVELYVPSEQKDDAFAALSAVADDELRCPACKILFTRDMENCPVCGAQPQEHEI